MLQTDTTQTAEISENENPGTVPFWGELCIQEIMFRSDDSELAEFLKSDDEKERRAAYQEILSRAQEKKATGQKTYKVRFHHTGFYEIEVEAKNDDEADELAKKLFSENQTNAKLLRAEFGHMTLEIAE